LEWHPDNAPGPDVTGEVRRYFVVELAFEAGDVRQDARNERAGRTSCGWIF